MEVLYWGIAAGAFLIIELIIPALISIWFALASFILMFLSFVIPSIRLQILIFAIISIVSILISKTILKKFFDTPNTKEASNIGDEVTIVKVFENNKYEIRYKGTIWSAKSEDFFKEGDIAYIKCYVGNKIIIEK